MKKTAAPKKLHLQKQAIANLTPEQLQLTGGARPPFFPPSWFQCAFTIWCD